MSWFQLLYCNAIISSPSLNQPCRLHLSSDCAQFSVLRGLTKYNHLTNQEEDHFPYVQGALMPFFPRNGPVNRCTMKSYCGSTSHVRLRCAQVHLHSSWGICRQLHNNGHKSP
mmetsp:Transcript_17462/g.40006  ORF Transcript_17462/g.40006 Transcript_17462/m.40006 type:complete len:113 (-) Transcript_17462:1269-1607(-)